MEGHLTNAGVLEADGVDQLEAAAGFEQHVLQIIQVIAVRLVRGIVESGGNSISADCPGGCGPM